MKRIWRFSVCVFVVFFLAFGPTGGGQAIKAAGTPYVTSIQLTNVTEHGFDVALALNDNGTPIQSVRLYVWRSGNYAGMIGTSAPYSGPAVQLYHVSMASIGAGSDDVYIGVHYYDSTGAYQFIHDYSFELDVAPPSLSLSQPHASWTAGDATIHAAASDNFNIVPTIGFSGPGANQTAAERAKPKILSLESPSSGYMPTLQALEDAGYSVTVNTGITNVSQMAGYDIILVDRYCWAVSDSDSSLLNQAFLAGKRILTIGNDTGNNLSIIKGFNHAGDSRGYTLVPYSDQGVKASDPYYASGAFDHLTRDIGGYVEADGPNRNYITGWTLGARPVAMDSTYTASPDILEAVNDAGGKWLHFQLTRIPPAMVDDAVNELLWGTSAARQAYEQDFAVSQNGTYTVAAKDLSGNTTTKTITVSTIDRTPPSLSVAGNPATAVHSPVMLTASSSDSQSGVKKVETPDGVWHSGSSASYSVSANGSYTFKSVDNVGNTSSQTVNVSQIGSLLWSPDPPPSLISASAGVPSGASGTISADGPSFSVVDNRPSSPGWSVTAQALPVKSGTHTLPAGSIQFAAPSLSGGVASSPLSGYQAIDGSSPVKVAASSGGGSTTLGFGSGRMHFVLPAKVYAGTYTTTVTFQIQNAP